MSGGPSEGGAALTSPGGDLSDDGATHDSSGQGNGSHDAPPATERAAPPREFHAEPHESGAAHEAAPLAHFEPAPRHEGATPESKPYVIWSSAPPEKSPGGRGGPEE